MPLKLQWDHVIITNMSVGRTQARSAFMLRSTSCRSAPHTCAHTQGDWNPLSSWERLCIEWGNCSVCILTNPAGDTCVHAHSENTSSQAYAGASKQGEETVTTQRIPSPHRYKAEIFSCILLVYFSCKCHQWTWLCPCCRWCAETYLKFSPHWGFFLFSCYLFNFVSSSKLSHLLRQKPFLLILMINNWAHL